MRRQTFSGPIVSSDSKPRSLAEVDNNRLPVSRAIEATEKREGAAMPIPETQRELIVYLDSLTRTFGQGGKDRFTTASIARELSVSRNLASHYLNDMVRAGIAVKVGNRPVYYLHRRALERLFQVRIECSSFDSMGEFLHSCGVGEAADFAHAVGCEGSLQACVACCKAAFKYPPDGLPLLLEGAPGTGKSLLAHLAFRFGRNTSILGDEASFVCVECSSFTSGARDIVSAVFTDEGFAAQAAGGVILFRDADQLMPAQASELLAATVDRATHQAIASRLPRMIFTVTNSDTQTAALLKRRIPMHATVPTYRERPVAEREELVRHFFRQEGTKIGADILVSRGALRLLCNADLRDNVRELQTCITTCCADAYAQRQADSIEINVWQLPPQILGSYATNRQDDDGQLVDMMRGSVHGRGDLGLQALDVMMNAFEAYCIDGGDFDRLEHAVLSGVRDFSDALLFDDGAHDARISAYEQIFDDILADVSKMHGVVFTRRDARLLAREVSIQLWPRSEQAAWRFANAAELAKLGAVLERAWRFPSVVAAQVVTAQQRSLGIEPDDLSRVLLLVMVHVNEAASVRRTSVGIVLSHGFATASSIADAANRILNDRLFEAIDMHYDQQVAQIVEPLRAMLARYAYCSEIVLLVDMGSLEQIDRDLGVIAGHTLGVINNISTGLAVEIGAGLLAGRSMADVLAEASEACQCRFRVIEGASREAAILFCAEGGAGAAEKIKALVAQSLSRDVSLRLIAYDAERLLENGRQDALFGMCTPIAVIGTVDPQLDGVPFIPLEDLISNEADETIDAIFSPYLQANELAQFHQNLLKTLTLRNVVESITILNPTRLFNDIEQAVHRLEELTGSMVAERVKIGLYVHLCCLVERLVTHAPIEKYGNQDEFLEHHRDFVVAFRRSFADIAARYSVDVPLSEIAYAFDYIRAPRPSGRRHVAASHEDE